jgi:type II secretory pathway component PulF
MKTFTPTIAQQATLYKALRQYLTAGFSLAQAFTLLAEQEHGDKTLATCWAAMAQRLHTGQSLDQAARSARLILPKPWLLLVSESGFYETAFGFLASRYDAFQGSIATLKTRTILPIVVFFLLCFIRQAQALVLNEISLGQCFWQALQPMVFASISILALKALIQHGYQRGHGLAWQIPLVRAWQQLQFTQALVFTLNSREDVYRSLGHLRPLLAHKRRASFSAQLALMQRGQSSIAEVVSQSGYFSTGEQQLFNAGEQAGEMSPQAERILLQLTRSFQDSLEQTVKIVPWLLYAYLLALLLFV